MTLNPPRRDNLQQSAKTGLARHFELVIFMGGIIVGYILCRL